MTVLDHNRAKLDEMHVVKAREIAGFLGLNRSDTSSSTTQVAKAAKLAEGCGSMIVFEQWMRYQAGRRISPWDVRRDGQSLVDEIVDHHGKVKSLVDSIFEESDESEKKNAAMLEMARFLGFLRRAIVAQTAGGVPVR